MLMLGAFLAAIGAILHIAGRFAFEGMAARWAVYIGGGVLFVCGAFLATTQISHNAAVAGYWRDLVYGGLLTVFSIGFFIGLPYPFWKGTRFAPLFWIPRIASPLLALLGITLISLAYGKLAALAGGGTPILGT
ncbi:MAG: hypothetical protein WDN24_10810 [Sphingomonas sp.]